MNLLKGYAFGLIAGIVGAIAWATIMFYANAEIGYLAWGIGGLVGFAVAFGHQGGGAAAGAVAVLITVLSICGGKYVGADWAVGKAFAEEAMFENPSDTEFSEDQKIGMIAEEEFDAAVKRGEHAEFEPAIESEDPKAYYPAEVWDQATASWNAMSAEQRQEKISSRIALMNELAKNIRSQFAWETFKASFNVLDIVFFCLGIATAWRIACVDRINEPAPSV